MAFEPPERLVRALDETPHDGDAAWRQRLPDLVEEALGACGAVPERVHAPGGRSSVVVLVRLPEDTPAVLKLAPPSAVPEAEALALERWDGWGACRLLDRPAPGTLLLERLRPDVSLRSLAQAKALLEAADTLRKLWVEAPADGVVPTVAERTAAQAACLAEAPELYRPLADAALTARSGLLTDAPENLLLHGAYGQGKVLAGARAPWLAVGPSPVTGERAYDLARLGLDRVEDLVGADTGGSSSRRRLSRLADSLDVDRERLRAWTLFRATYGGVAALRRGRRPTGEALLEYAGWL
ncbi:aminoglycoside phosphotransferase family protein [Streptomyces diastaticus]|uniref:Kinase n=2 Tax=Streptomyces diastaticus group TaxID=2849069 RepID=A0ABQ1CV70_STRDI|nr:MULTISPECIES: aminoglycoside phosphotransferase family protein [Streptomyces]NEE30283.1 kinase [Streptomyces sp. SID7982]NEE44100.1 kinase [Streptomyces sp. SID8455]WSU35374.1 aminoglycoside phosphotransferase family protein [Streptomyces gougerotii]PJM80954.1 kinase [Streptomyces sp. TSRI0384-2]QNE83499.1 kinase [Streptomyces rutgersensis]